MADLLQIGHLRARSGSLDRTEVTAARLRISTALASVDLHPTGLPPSSILIVRALADQGGEGMLVDGRIPRPSSAWVEATRTGLGDLARDAVRPRNGYLPENATAVVFSDEAELLAFLAMDLTRGRASSRWWWQALLARHPDWLAGPGTMLAERPRLVPQILGRLDQWSALDRVAAAIEPRACAELIRLLADAYALPVPPTAIASSIWLTTPERIRETSTSPPWRLALQTVAPVSETNPIREFLLGLALMLLHRPVEVRSAEFFLRTNSWLQECLKVASTGARSGPDGLNGLQSETPVAPLPESEIESAGESISGRRQRSPDAGFTDASANRPPPVENDVSGDKVRPTIRTQRSDERTPTRIDRTESTDDSRSALSIRSDVQEIATELAGVFYLINLMTDLRIPYGEEIRWQPADVLGPWRTLHHIALGLLGDAADVADPVWTLLEELGTNDLPHDGDDAITSVRERFVPRVRDRLTDLLHVHQDELGDVLLRRNGHVFVTPSHLDVVMSMEAISRAVRLSGLDRDPGWLPTWGRVIRFHFN